MVLHNNQRAANVSSTEDCEGEIRTSAAAAAAAFGSFAALLSPKVRGGPPTVRFGELATLLGTEALVVGAGAEPNVRPWPSKLSLDSLPQRFPMAIASVRFVRRVDGGRRICLAKCG